MVVAHAKCYDLKSVIRQHAPIQMVWWSTIWKN